VNDIKDFANREGIPFVLAAQFNREVDSPISVDTKNIGEGGDFERIADTCIGLFNLKELHPLPKNKDEEKAAKRLLSDLGAATYAQGDELKPIQGKLFVKADETEVRLLSLRHYLRMGGTHQVYKAQL
jgi:hypothetical protein